MVTDFEKVLATLAGGGVEFIVIGSRIWTETCKMLVLVAAGTVKLHLAFMDSRYLTIPRQNFSNLLYFFLSTMALKRS